MIFDHPVLKFKRGTNAGLQFLKAINDPAIALIGNRSLLNRLNRHVPLRLAIVLNSLVGADMAGLFLSGRRRHGSPWFSPRVPGNRKIK